MIIPVLAPALKFISAEISRYYDNPITGPSIDFVILGNISRLDMGADAGSAGLQSNVVLTLINIEEEKTLKNGANFIQRGESIVRQNRSVYLNLYLLFSCADDDYETALTKIGRIIGFFQDRNVFTAETADTPFPDGLEKMIFDLFSLNFEQVNHLWGVLGGKYIPSVLYKVRLIEIQQSLPAEGPAVRELKSTENSN